MNRGLLSCSILASIVVLGPVLGSAGYKSVPSPLCNEHLVIVRPVDFRSSSGSDIPPYKLKEAMFGEHVVACTNRVNARLCVRFKGRYFLWIRIGQHLMPRMSLSVELRAREEVLLSRSVNDGPGSVDHGGPEGYEAYVRQAIENAPDGAAIPDISVAAEYQQHSLSMGEDGTGASAIDELGNELLTDLRKPSGENWVSPYRIDARTPSGLYWWKIGAVDLAPGRYNLHIVPGAPNVSEAAPLIDGAFLTTYDKLVYPYCEDVSASRASYIRFRIDEMPKHGIRFRTSINNHIFPYLRTPTVYFNPDGLSDKAAQAHLSTGYTPWYCLQDIERAPSLKRFGQVQMYIRTSGQHIEERDVKGITQFAMYPYNDEVLREFDLNEPDGSRINMIMDFENNLQYLRTFRDCARWDYEQAMRSAHEQVYPLTRDGLYLGGSAGGATPDMNDYICKTLRILGYNVARPGPDRVAVRERYGWGSFAGWPRMAWYTPFTNDLESTKQYETDYGKCFAKDREFYEGCSVWQLCDEPGEGYRHTMSAPLWRYEETDNGTTQWVDHVGESGLYTTRTNYQNCVLEGKVARLGGVVRFVVAADKPQLPTRCAYWRVGKVDIQPTSKQNLHACILEPGHDPKLLVSRENPNAVLNAKFTPFKIVYENSMAALYIKDKIVHQFSDLPAHGAFGFDEQPKALADLRFRRIRRGEHLVPLSSDGTLTLGVDDDVGTLTAAEDFEEILEEDGEQPAWVTTKPLKEFVAQDWTITGGVPGAHEGFREWVATQGVTPELFGKTRWSDVRPLTVKTLVRDMYDARAFYWGRQYTAYLTPKMFSLAAAAVRKTCPNRQVRPYIGLSGGYLNVFDCTVIDMFQLASYTNGLMPGISDWYSTSAESQQVNAYSAAIFNAGARRYGRDPGTISMMHVVHPTAMRAYTCLANDVKYLSYYTFGPYCLGAGGDAWSERPYCYDACSLVNNRVAQVDDIMRHAHLRRSRVAMLWSQANDH